MAADGHDGHRKRLDDKSDRLGFEFLEEHEQLEKLLFAVIQRGNTNGIAHRLIERFGSLYGVLTTEPEELVKVEGVGERTAQFLHDLLPLLGCVQRCALREGEKDYPYLNTSEKRAEFAKTLFYGRLNENLFMVSINRRFRAYRFDRVSEGSAEETPVYVQELIRHALRTKARYIMLAHNHPSGDLTPSGDDIETTKELRDGLSAVGITLLDHYIVGHGRVISMKELGVI